MYRVVLKLTDSGPGGRAVSDYPSTPRDPNSLARYTVLNVADFELVWTTDVLLCTILYFDILVCTGESPDEMDIVLIRTGEYFFVLICTASYSFVLDCVADPNTADGTSSV